MTDAYQSIRKTLLKYKTRKTIPIGEVHMPTSIIKCLVAFNDYSFPTRTGDDPIMVEPITNVKYSLEERSDATSLLLSMADELIQIQPTDLLMIDDSFIMGKHTEKLVLDACRFKAFKEFEILIESLGYRYSYAYST